ncbi:MAG TPA: class I SAM-dependent rRNA methyltransferase [Polyangiales bacterium]|nr:class I SAM-dependent rRNA methyltransferase [Polyangiales bacterium]
MRLRKPLERSLRSGHPWVFREALEALDVAPGTQVRVLDRQGRFVATGLADAGPIGVRVFSLRDEAIDAALFERRVTRALTLRQRVLPAETDAYRLLHGEGDALPGFVCDRYANTAVLKLDGEAAAARLQSLLDALTPQLAAIGVSSLVLRTSRKQADSCEVVWGSAPAREFTVLEHGMRLWTNVYDGQKTGLFLDHRETRRRVRALAAGLSVLNLYGYTGGFSVAAGLGGATRVTTVDQAKPALALAERSFVDNGLSAALHTCVAEDAIAFLTAAKERGERFQLIISDPPNFAPRKTAVESAQKAYEALHSAALALLEPDGLYLAASCSSHIDRALFEETLRRGASYQRRVLQVLELTGAPADHPRLLAFPEGDYLKVLLTRA